MMSLVFSLSQERAGEYPPTLDQAARSRVMMIAPVLWCGLVREHFIVGHIVPIHVVARRAANSRRAGAQITNECRDRDVHNVIPKAPTVGPATGNGATAETSLDGAGQGVVPKN